MGAFQGDPLLVAIFDMALNLYTDALEPIESCAYQFPSFDLSLYNSIFADAAVVVACGFEEAKHVCPRIDQFLE